MGTAASDPALGLAGLPSAWLSATVGATYDNSVRQLVTGTEKARRGLPLAYGRQPADNTAGR